MRALRQIILKIHSRCNLACSYCYATRDGQPRHSALPAVMSSATIDAVARRAAEHAERFRLPSLHVLLHGGEPLLAGPSKIGWCVQRFRDVVGDRAVVHFSVQTNGVRLTDTFLDMFRDLAVSVGVSLDGDQAAHDRHRRLPSGSGSYEAVARSLRMLTDYQYRHLFAGLLSVVDVRNDPIDTYQGLLTFSPPMIDFLLPFGHWSMPPPGVGPEPRYGRWLAAVFDRWYAAPHQETRVRLFEEIMNQLLGRASQTEGIGSSPLATVIVNTDGSIGEIDTLVAESAQRNGRALHVTTDPLASAVHLPGIAESRLGIAALSETCRTCRFHPVCGGGLYANRYRRGSGYANPSVYCEDLRLLVGHIRERMLKDITALRRLTSTGADAAP